MARPADIQIVSSQAAATSATQNKPLASQSTANPEWVSWVQRYQREAMACESANSISHVSANGMNSNLYSTATAGEM